jgi:hypothetical protein
VLSDKNKHFPKQCAVMQPDWAHTFFSLPCLINTLDVMWLMPFMPRRRIIISPEITVIWHNFAAVRTAWCLQTSPTSQAAAKANYSDAKRCRKQEILSMHERVPICSVIWSVCCTFLKWKKPLGCVWLACFVLIGLHAGLFLYIYYFNFSASRFMMEWRHMFVMCDGIS